jgi:pimeloyl-ACP methyl ester carboxylesterase
MSDILLIHGAWHGPWCWDAFAQRLTARGHQVRALQLRGHDQRPGRLWHRLSDYVEDVRRAAAESAQPPFLVGHSMGGLLVQKYLERHPAAGAVLMASLAVGSTIPAVIRLAARHPIPFLKAKLSWSLRPFIATTALVRDLFFTQSTPADIVNACAARLQDESFFAFLDLMFVTTRPREVRAPVFVLGAELDAFLTIDEVVRTARAYGTEPEIVPDIGHDMMLDQGWQAVADRVGALAGALTLEQKAVRQTHSNVSLARSDELPQVR